MYEVKKDSKNETTALTKAVEEVVNSTMLFIKDFSPEFVSAKFRAEPKVERKIVSEFIKKVIFCVWKTHGVSSLVTCTSSSGLVLILVFKNYVLKIACEDSYEKMKLAHQKLPDSPYLSKILESNDEFMYTVEEVIDPIAFEFELKPKYKNRKEQLINDIKKAIYEFQKCGLCHADLRLDNIGYKASTNTFALFDYNSCKMLTPQNKDIDMHMFVESMSYYIV